MSIHAVAFAVLAAIHPPPATTERTDAFIDAVAPPGAGHWLPTDPAQRAAVRALRGDFGKLASWQQRGYTLIQRDGATCSTPLVLTAYWPGEGRDGQVDANGARCRPGTLASNKLRRGSYVYLPSFERLGRVTDCGSRANDRRAARAGGTWVDVWLARPSEARGRCDWTLTNGAVSHE